MYGVVRFLDTELLPASSPEDYPKIIKSGIDDEFQHPKSPKITGPSGIATLLHRIGRPQLLERLLDVDGTQEYNLLVRTGFRHFQDVYVKRRGQNVEIGFIGSDGRWAQHGVRYFISPPPPSSPYRIGKWNPVSTSDRGSYWGGTEYFVRGQGAAVAKAIWFHKHFDRPDVEVSWSGMTVAEKEELTVWLAERAERIRQQLDIAETEYKERKALLGDEYTKLSMGSHKLRLACRADCGKQDDVGFMCSKCKLARYCSVACQAEDWKYHKTYCGTEPPIPKEYFGITYSKCATLDPQ